MGIFLIPRYDLYSWNNKKAGKVVWKLSRAIFLSTFFPFDRRGIDARFGVAYHEKARVHVGRVTMKWIMEQGYGYFTSVRLRPRDNWEERFNLYYLSLRFLTITDNKSRDFLTSWDTNDVKNELSSAFQN